MDFVEYVAPFSESATRTNKFLSLVLIPEQTFEMVRPLAYFTVDVGRISLCPFTGTLKEHILFDFI